jgi:predicted metal-dependent HD superfamily phosphohydrolase
VLDEVSGVAEAPDLVEFALWLHDAVYVPGAADNEERSAARAEQFLATLHAAAHAATVRGLILATRHAARPARPDERLVADIDLAVLACPTVAYDAYAAAIRAEYAAVPDADFRAGRRGFLQALLARPALYHTPLLHARCEAAARRNLARELQQLA